MAPFEPLRGEGRRSSVYHAAGLDGLGGASYIDLVIMRLRDANTAWTAASDGTLEEPIVDCQNWPADIVFQPGGCG